MLGKKFCLSGGIPNFLLSHGKPEDLRAHVKKVIDEVARDGGYIVDASAIMQNDTDAEKLRAMTDFVRDYGVYSTGHRDRSARRRSDRLARRPTRSSASNYGMRNLPATKIKAGVCIPWEEKLKELPKINGDEQLTKRIWENIEGFGNMFIWQCLLSF